MASSTVCGGCHELRASAIAGRAGNYTWTAALQLPAGWLRYRDRIGPEVGASQQHHFPAATRILCDNDEDGPETKHWRTSAEQGADNQQGQNFVRMGAEVGHDGLQSWTR